MRIDLRVGLRGGQRELPLRHPVRRESSSATTSASSDGSRNWFPAAIRSETARTTGAGACPQNALMSATYMSTYSWPSRSQNRGPAPCDTQTGGWSYSSSIHDTGTPRGIVRVARDVASIERGRSSRNRSASATASAPILA